MTHLEFTCSDEKATALLRAARLFDEGIEPAQWISVNDRLPPHQGKKVLVINGHGDVRIYALWKREYGNKWTWLDVNGKFNHVNDITHWMPLPEPPKEV